MAALLRSPYRALHCATGGRPSLDRGLLGGHGRVVNAADAAAAAILGPLAMFGATFFEVPITHDTRTHTETHAQQAENTKKRKRRGSSQLT